MKRTRNNPVREASYNWRGGRSYCDKGGKGYVRIMVYPEHPFYHMRGVSTGKTTGAKRILEHRLIMAQYLGRALLNNEQVHHKNGIRDDNRLENLDLMPNIGSHTKMMICSKCELRKQIYILKQENTKLKATLQLQMKEGK